MIVYCIFLLWIKSKLYFAILNNSVLLLIVTSSIEKKKGNKFIISELLKLKIN